MELFNKTVNASLGWRVAQCHAVGHPEQTLASAAIGLGNTLEALLGSVLIRRLVALPDVSHTIRAVFLFLLATLACCAIASAIGVASLVAVGALPTRLMSAAGFTWWLGDATGMWIVAPLVVAWARAAPGQRRAQLRAGSLLALGFLLLVCALTFSSWLERLLDGTQAQTLAPVLIKLLAYMLIPLLLWIEFRFGPLAGTLGTIAACGFAVLGTVGGLGPFVGASQNESLLFLQGFIGVASIAVLLLDGALRERSRALDALTEVRDELEQRVRVRTAELDRINHALTIEVDAHRQALDRLGRETVERQRAEETLHQAQKMDAI